ncbi:short chain dehydrogenase [Streptosporangium canum]|uniref:Short chain dehydrogenase n=1 Tax=Streptosporangium canum TaxID=324952 RepID=A0A1I4FKK8_9ACTN|nr:SDR family NAD(P)-dependent oxidoreductase [Streptosporangium canum]SFL17850.1 short chain dehydrogenase [Streptosporangium canum]
MIEVNVHGIAAALPVFTAQGGGHFVTIASIGAHQVSPAAAVYCATRYAAWAITEGLRQESDPSIRVTTISPGWSPPKSPIPSPTVSGHEELLIGGHHLPGGWPNDSR